MVDDKEFYSNLQRETAPQNAFLSQVAQMPQDQAAKILRLSMQAGIDPVEAARNPTATIQNLIGASDFEDVGKIAPKTYSFLQDPLHMAIARDKQSIMAMADMENEYKWWTALKNGAKGLVRDPLAAVQGAVDTLAQGSQSNRDAMPPEYQMWHEQGGTNALQDTAQAVGNVVKSDLLKRKDVKADTVLGQYGLDVAETAPQIAAQIALAFFTGGASSTAFMGAQIAGSEYQKLRGEGVAADRALAAGVMDAAAQTPFERIGLNRIIRAFPKGSTRAQKVTEVLKAGFTEGITEWVQQYPESAVEIWARHPEFTPEQRGAQFWKDFAETTKEGAYQGLVAAPFGFLGGAVKVSLQKKATETFIEQRERMQAMIAASPVLQTSPELVEKHLNSVAEGDTVFVDPDALVLYQSQNPEVVEQLGVTPEQISEASQQGHMVEIPVGTYDTVAAQHPDMQVALKDDIAPDEDGYTKRRLDERNSKDIRKATEESIKQREEIKTESVAIMEQMKAAGISGDVSRQAMTALKSFAYSYGADNPSQYLRDHAPIFMKGQTPAVDALKQYAGVKSKTANRTQLQIAMDMLAAGKNTEEIRRSTGWHQGMDGKWRYEIDDSQAVFHESDDFSNSLPEVLEHPGLYKAYPNLQKVDVIFAELPDDIHGAYDRNTNEIVVNEKLSTSEKRETILHEVQHAIQKRERFARGGSPEMQDQSRNPIGDEGYDRLAGEIEARDTVARGDLTAEQRKNIAPDIRSDAIVIHGGREYNYNLDSTWKNNEEAPSATSELFQSEKNPKGQIQWTEEGRAVITLFEQSDPSTVIHEMVGHFFMQRLIDQGATDAAPDWMKKDRQAVLEFVGLIDWETATKEERKAAHEKLAKAAEVYIMEGKAPSIAMRGIFRKFKAWLLEVYKAVTELDAELNPEIRGVFDRMLATQAEIEQVAIAENYYEQLPKELMDKLTPAQQDRLDKAIAGSKEKAVELLTKETMRWIRADNKFEMEQTREEALQRYAEEVNNEPIYRAIDQITRDFRKDARKVAEQFKAGKLPEDQEVEFEYVATGQYNYSSGDELATRILRSLPKDQEITARVEAYIGSMFRDIMNDKAALEDEARAAVYNDESMAVLAAQREIINKEMGDILKAEERRQEAIQRTEEARLAAQWTLESKPIEDAIRLQTFITAERRAAEKKAKALAQKNFQEARDWLDVQMYNHALVQQSLVIRREFERINKYLKRQRKSDKKTWGSEDYFVQAAEIMRRLGLARKDYNQALKEESLLDYYRRMETENPDMAAISDFVLMKSQQDQPINPRKLTLDQLRDMENALRNIKTMGRHGVNSDSFVVIDTGDSVSSAAAQMVLAAEKNVKDVQLDEPERTKKGLISQTIADFKAGLIKPSQFFLRLDGMKSFGLWDRVMYHFMDAAQNHESRLIGKVTEALEEAFVSEGISKEQRYLDANKKIYISEWNVSVSRQYLRTIRLNMGSKSNKDRLFSKAPVGFPQSESWKNSYWTEEEVLQVLIKYLDAKDFRLVNKIWKAINLYDEYNTMVKRMTGFTLPKVDAVPSIITLPNGEQIYSDGGYYPLKQDSRASKQAEMNADKSLNDDYVGVMPYPSSGASKGRVNAKYAVDLEFSNIYQHIKDVSHDIAFRPVMHDINKIMRKDEIKNVLRRKLGDEGYKAIVSWQKAVASSRDTAKEQGLFDGTFNALRQRAVVANLLLRPATITQNAANFLLYGNAVEGFSDKDALTAYMKHGWGDYIPNALGKDLQRARILREYVYSKSVMMRDKMENPDFSLRELHGLGMQDNKLMRMESEALQNAGIKIALTQEKVLNFGSDLLAWADQITDIPMWLGAYEKATQEKLSESEAVRFADTVIERSTGTGRRIDTSQMQRGSPTERLFSMFMTFLNTQYNRWAMEANIFLKEKDVLRLMKFVGMRYLAFGFISALASFKTPDDEEDLFEWFIRDILEWPLGLIPIGGGAVKYAFDTAMGFKTYSYGLTPVERNIEDAIRLFGTVTSDKKTAAEKTEAVSTTAAYTLKYPDQLNDWFWNAYDILANDMDPQFTDLIRRRPRKER